MAGEISQAVKWIVLTLTLCCFSFNTVKTRGCRLDLCLLLDESGSIGSANFEIMKNFLVQFVDLLYIGPDSTQIGLVKFSSGARFIFPLNQHDDDTTLKTAIMGLSYDANWNNLDKGLEMVQNNCFKIGNGDRVDAPNIAVILIDGKPTNHEGAASLPSATDKALMAGERLRESGADIVAIAIGDIDWDFLYIIANGAANVFEVDFTSLTDIVQNITGRVCEASKYCPRGQFNAGPGTYPELLECPTLHNPQLTGDRRYVLFVCSLNYTVTSETAAFKVTFKFDGKEDPKVPSFILNAASNGVNATLYEWYLVGHMKKSISCTARGFDRNNPNDLGPEIISRSYWMGMTTSHKRLNVFEKNDTASLVYIYSTLPPTCRSLGCHHDFVLTTGDTSHIAIFQDKRNTEINQCKYTQLPRDWKPQESLAYNYEYPVQVFPWRDPFHGPPRVSQISLKSQDYGRKSYINESGVQDYYTPIWNGYEMDPVIVTVFDDDFATCSSSGDPRIDTFDGRYYTGAQTGNFIYVKSDTIHDFEIHVRHFECQPGVPGCSIACGVAAKEGPYAFGMDNCFDDPRDSSGPLTYTVVSDPDPQTGIFYDSSAKQYTMKFLGGARIYVNERSRGVNIIIQLPGREFGKTRGLCGTFDGDSSNDFTKNT